MRLKSHQPADHPLEQEGNHKLAPLRWLTAGMIPHLETPPPPPSAHRVLYADDSETLRLVVARFLKDEGFSVETAVDGAEGWRKILQTATDAETAFHVVITDLDMPNLDGVGFVRLLRESRQPVKIIVYSGSLSRTCLAELQNLSVDATLTKGMNADDLVEVVKKITGWQA